MTGKLCISRIETRKRIIKKPKTYPVLDLFVSRGFVKILTQCPNKCPESIKLMTAKIDKRLEAKSNLNPLNNINTLIKGSANRANESKYLFSIQG